MGGTTTRLGQEASSLSWISTGTVTSKNPMEATRATIRLCTSPRNFEKHWSPRVACTAWPARSDQRAPPVEAGGADSVCATFWVGLWAGLEASGEGSDQRPIAGAQDQALRHARLFSFVRVWV